MANEGPAFGRRLLPQVVDELAKTDPDRVFGSFAASDNLDDGFVDVSFRQLAQSVDALAWKLYKQFTIRAPFETVAFLGLSDLRYAVVCLAGIKCGLKVLLLGSRSSKAQNLNMVRRLQCTKVLCVEEVAEKAKELVESSPAIEILMLASLSEMLSSKDDYYPFNKTFAEARDDPIIVVHSSGSTGIPKLVTMTHGTLSVTDGDRNMLVPKGRRGQNGDQFNFKGGGRFYSCFPPYHLAGLQATLILPVFSTSASIVLGPPQIPSSGFLLKEIVDKQPSLRAIYVPPSILEQWILEAGGYEQARQLDFVLYGGGALSSTVGNILKETADVCQMYGSAETGQIQVLVPHKENWEYFEWNPYEEVDMQPAQGGTFELVLHYEDRFATRRSLHFNFPEIKEWRSGDLFVPHPNLKGLWKFHCRVDDLIVLSNSHKVNPHEIESVFTDHPLVTGALVIGTARPHILLLLEIARGANSHQDSHILDELWPLVQEVNKVSPAHAQLLYNRVMLNDPAKPFVRTPKRTVIRNATLQLYQEQIDATYEHASAEKTGAVWQGTTQQELEVFIKHIVERILDTKLANLSHSLFSYGLDSLKAIELINELKQGLPHLPEENIPIFSMRTIYRYPSIDKLSEGLFTLLHPEFRSEIECTTTKEHLLQAVENGIASIKSVRHIQRHRVLLTGASGLIGASVLDGMLQDSDIEIVYCLKRKNSPTNTPSITSPKLKTLYIDYYTDMLGLDSSQFLKLAREVTVIVHLAWQVDFNATLELFEMESLKTLYALITLSLSAPIAPRIVFASSTGYAIDWAHVNQTAIPESVLDIVPEPKCTGYAQSKQVAEQVLHKMHKNYGLPITILRAGQIAAPRSGSDREDREWVHCLLKTSEALGMIPLANFSIDWVRLSDFAGIILEALKLPISQDKAEYVFNIVNPTPSSWSSFAEAVQKTIPKSRVVSFEEWLDALERQKLTTSELAKRYPSLKMVDFLKYLIEYHRSGRQASFDTHNARTTFALMKTMRPIAGEWEAAVIGKPQKQDI